MSRRNKLVKFEEVLSFPNVYQNFTPKNPKLVGMHKIETDWKGNWSLNHFQNDHELVLELACGKGDYCLALAERYPGKNFIGVDIKGSRIWKGAKLALEKNLANVAFLRTRIEQLEAFMQPDEVSELWITFPDPFPRKSKANRRLSAELFLKLYSKILCPGGIVHLKTDAVSLYKFSLEQMNDSTLGSIIKHSEDIYANEPPHKDLDIKTFYEKMHLEAQKKICYIQFQLNQ